MANNKKTPKTLFQLGSSGGDEAPAAPPVDDVAADTDDQDLLLDEMASDELQYACGACGALLPTGASFCGECGTPVATEFYDADEADAAVADEAVAADVTADETLAADTALIDAVPVRPGPGEAVPEGDSLSKDAPFRIVNIGNSDKVRLLDFIDANSGKAATASPIAAKKAG